MRQLTATSLRSSTTKPFLLALALVLFVLFSLLPHCVHAIESSPHFYRENQPDGSTTPPLAAKGGPRFHYVTDSKGFTVIEDENKWFVYADDAVDGSGQVSSSGMRVGMGNPEKKGIHQGVVPVGEARTEQCNRLCDYYDDDGNRRLEGRQLQAISTTSTRGVLKNLVVLMRFSDHKARTLPSQADIDALMNSIGGDPSLAPTGSVRDVYLQSSYNQLTVESTIYPWITLPETEHYYADNRNGFSEIFVEALHDALAIIDKDPNFSFRDFDVNDDNTIDAITFLHSGYGAEWSSTDCHGSGAAQRIWSHKWTMPSRLHWHSSDGVRVNKYHISPAIWGTCGSNIGRIGVIAHELGHFLGLPDLYDGSGGEGVGSFDLMGNSWGFDGSQRYPPILSSWCKIQLGWATPTVLSSSGSYSLHAWATTPAVYRIDKGFPSGEYLLIENRQKEGFDFKMPQAGLTIFHIDEKAPSIDEEGYPGQEGWPTNGKHYRVALLQADGNYDLEKGNGRGDAGDVWHSGDSIGPYADVAPEQPYPNTDSYQDGQIRPTGIQISHISAPKQQMTFHLSFGGDDEPEQPVPSPTAVPTGTPQGKEFVTTFAGGNGQAGNMFDIETTKTIDITTLDIHTVSTSTVNVEVWIKSGSYLGYEADQDAWTKVASVAVQGQGIRNRTPLPLDAFEEPIRVMASQRQAFYVTLTTPDIRYTADGAVGQAYAHTDSDDIKFFVGAGLKYAFGEAYSPRVWNGVLTYEIVKGSTISPTIDPTDMPTDPYWSAFPSLLPSATPTTSKPTKRPTKQPTSEPTPAAEYKISTLSTPLDGGTGQAGNMFDIVPGKDLVILDMSIHTISTSDVDVRIWIKEGSYRKHENERKSWRRIVKTTVRGQGEGQLTPLPEGAFPPIQLSASQRQALYVTLTTAEIHYSKGRKQGLVYASNDDLSILEGIGKAFPFKATYKPRVWHGQIKYAVLDDPNNHIPTPMPMPTPSPIVRELRTTMDGDNGQAGNMFDIRAINEVDIRGITHIHTSASENVHVEVWTKVGSYQGDDKNKDAWTQIASVSVQGSGKDQRTLLPDDIFGEPIHVEAGEIQSFYVTLTTAEMRYSDGNELDAVYASSPDLQVLQGIGKAYPFKKTYKPRLWNGGLLYSVRSNE